MTLFFSGILAAVIAVLPDSIIVASVLKKLL
jgi:hypothetical protein